MTVQQKGRQTREITPPPRIIATAAIGGYKEKKSPLAADFDYIYDDIRAGCASFEKAEHEMQMKAANFALSRAGLKPEDIDILLAGDLLNQITVSGFTARQLAIPYLGIFAACSTFTQGLGLGALLLGGNAAGRALIVSGSHGCTSEKQFRFPNEYGSQKPPHSQYTATAAGAAILAASGGEIAVTALTIGKVVDLGVSDPFAFGAAMAPAVADSIAVHLQEMQRSAQDYDLIVTGDLGKVGREIAWELLQRRGINYDFDRFVDCGCLLYGQDSNLNAGASGCGCVASVSMGYLYHLLQQGKLRRILLAASGALMSPIANQQHESIPGISHAIVLERIDG